MIDLLQYTFFQNALIGSLLTGILCGLVGTYIVAHRMVFIVGGIAHASLGGVGICALLGWSPIGGAAVFSLLTGYSVQGLSHRREVREDSAIAMLWAFGMSIGIFCTFLSPSFLPSLSYYLFGNILLINTLDLVLLGALTFVSVIYFYLYMPQIVAVAFDYDFARSQGLPAKRIEYLLITIISLSVVACLRTAGIVMAISLLSIPQMTANLFTHNFRRMALLSMVFAIAGCLMGLAASYYFNVPSGATIILVCIIIYTLSRTIKRGLFCLSRRKIRS